MNSKQLLSARKLVKEYPTGKSRVLRVLKAVDLDIHRGEILAVVGPSGAGKSTLLHILGALDRPTSGELLIDDVTIFDQSDEQLAEFRNQKVGFVYQFHHLLPEFTALENTAMPGIIARKERNSVLERAEDLLIGVGLKDRLHHRPRELSGGEQQRVAFARALQNDPLMILADEPSGNLDIANSRSLHTLMWELVKEMNKTIVVVTHNLELADQADRVIHMLDGEIE